MGLKDTVHKTAENTKDAADEAMHRGQAEAEKERREIAGDTMTPGEKIRSVANQAKHATQAEIDAAKRKVRGNT